MKHKILLSLICTLYLTISFGQYQIGLIPRSSPDNLVYQKVGYTDIEIKYGSPNVKERTIWGELVPYEEVWRAGANKATTISLSTDISIDGKILEAGLYSFFILPKNDAEWIGIFNKVADQWGAFKYDESKDALRIPLNVEQVTRNQEALSYSIQSDGFKTGIISLHWESKILSFELDVEYLDNFISTIETRALESDKNIKWVLYLQGAEHLIDNEVKNELALEWLEKSTQLQDSIETWNKQFYPIAYIEAHRIYTKARYYYNNDDKEKAFSLLKELPSEKYELFYSRNEEEIVALIVYCSKK